MRPQELLGADPLGVKLNSWLDHLRERKRSETQIRTLTRKLMKTQEDERRMIRANCTTGSARTCPPSRLRWKPFSIISPP